MKGIATLMLWGGLLLAPLTSAEHVRLVGDVWPPFTDQRLPGNGLAVELVSTALQRAGHSTEYVEVPGPVRCAGCSRATMT